MACKQQCFKHLGIQTMKIKGKNLLIITSDEHRKDAMGCVGHRLIKTPNLDSLAARGSIF